jgi:hypothetical protein
MTLHINYWMLILFMVVIVASLLLMFVSSILRNEVTRLGFAHKGTSFWIESRRLPRKRLEIPSEQTDSKIV